MAEIINHFATNFEKSIEDCLANNSLVITAMIKEQLYSGMNGKEQYLSPTYDDDPFFEQEGYWYHRNKQYKNFKKMITPPESGTILGLPPRPENIPNLKITGFFYSEINAERMDGGLRINEGEILGSDLVSKYGEEIIMLSPTAIRHFNENYTRQAIEELYRASGYL